MTDLSAAIDIIEAKALQEPPQREVYIRVATLPGQIYVDLANERGEVVEITADGWRVITDAPVPFLRPQGMQALPTPQKGGSISQLRSLVNLPEEDHFTLILAWLVAAFRSDQQHPVVGIGGGEGSAKTALGAILQDLIDPNYAALGPLPRSTHEFRRAADNRYLLLFDNISALPTATSDELCRQATGGRARPIILNGIEDVVTRPDLAERCLFINCALISDDRRRTDDDIRTAFGTARPQILGVLYDAVSQGLKMLPQTKLDEMPRMADFSRWAMACEGSLLWPNGAFQPAYQRNRVEAVEKVVEADPVALAVQALIEERGGGGWVGTASQLDGALQQADLQVKYRPTAARALSGRLRRILTSLFKLGIQVEFLREGHDRSRVIRISRLTAVSDERASASPAPTAPSARPLGQGAPQTPVEPKPGAGQPNARQPVLGPGRKRQARLPNPPRNCPATRIAQPRSKSMIPDYASLQRRKRWPKTNDQR